MRKYSVKVNSDTTQGSFVIEYPSQLGDLLYSMADGLSCPMNVVIQRLEEPKEEAEHEDLL